VGYIAHHAIVVTSWQDGAVEAAHARAVEEFAEIDALVGRGGAHTVSPIVGSVVNGVRSFLVGPDGSKEGWGTSDEGDAARARFIRWLRDADYYLDWFEIRYGGDDPDVVVVRHHNGDDAGAPGASGEQVGQ